MEFRDLKKQYQRLKHRIDEAVISVMSDSNFISGKQVENFENRLAEFVGVKHCISCANGTDALRIVELAYGIGSGDAVFVPDFTFFATAETVADLKATPVFVDVEEHTFNISPTSLVRIIQRTIEEGKLRPRAIVAVDLFGLCADYSELQQIAKQYNLLLIEDGAQGFGGSINNQMACSFGDVATTSFFPAKPLGCYGDGGAIFTNDDNMSNLMRSICVHGKEGSKYNNVRIGMNSRLDTIQAAILDIKMDAFIDYEVEAVNCLSNFYNQQLLGMVEIPVIPQGYKTSWAQYTIRLASKEQRDALSSFLMKKNIPNMIYYTKCMHQQEAFKNLSYLGECPISEKNCNTVLQLPIHPYLTEDDILTVCDSIKEFLSE